MSGLYPDDSEKQFPGGQSITYPGLNGEGKFHNGDISDPSKPASYLPAEHINLLTDLLSQAVLAAKLTPNNSDPEQLASAILAITNEHSIQQNNPHNVTREQVGLSNIPNKVALTIADVDASSLVSLKLLKEVTKKDTSLDIDAIKSEIRKQCEDSCRPVSSTYWQLPGKKSPRELGLPGTWENISSAFGGCFFRAEGGAANSFGSGRQEDATAALYFAHQALFQGLGAVVAATVLAVDTLALTACVLLFYF